MRALNFALNDLHGHSRSDGNPVFSTPAVYENTLAGFVYRLFEGIMRSFQPESPAALYTFHS
jgi:hypothetical protein